MARTPKNAARESFVTIPFHSSGARSMPTYASFPCHRKIDQMGKLERSNLVVASLRPMTTINRRLPFSQRNVPELPLFHFLYQALSREFHFPSCLALAEATLGHTDCFSLGKLYLVLDCRPLARAVVWEVNAC
jgi:hypothetical protein